VAVDWRGPKGKRRSVGVVDQQCKFGIKDAEPTATGVYDRALSLRTFEQDIALVALRRLSAMTRWGSAKYRSPVVFDQNSMYSGHTR